MALGARLIHLVDFDGARPARRSNLEVVGAIAARVAVPLQLAGGLDSADAIRLAFAAGATRVVLTTGDRRPPRRAPRLPRGRRRLARGRPRPAAGAAGRLPVAARDRRRRSTAWSASSSAPGSGRFVLSHGGATPDLDRVAIARSVVRCRDPGGRRRPRPRRPPPPARRRRRRRHPRGGAPLRGHRLPRRPGGRRMTRSLRTAAPRARWPVVGARAPWSPAPARRRGGGSADAVGRAGRERRRRLGRGAGRPAARPSQPDAAPRGRDPDRHDRDRQGRHRDQDRGGPVADRGRQLRGARRVRLLRRRRRSTGVGPRTFVIQGGDPTGTGDRRPGLHDPGRAGHDDRTSAAPWRWPGPSQPNSVGSQFFIVLDDEAAGALVVVQHLPDHRRGHGRDGGRRRDHAPRPVASRCPTDPVVMTTVTVANP